MENPAAQTLPPNGQQKKGVPRQRPVSCRFCRSRKLRCSRETPCSNCVSRGIQCELDYATENPSTAHSATELELLGRIRKLEELVENQESQQNKRVKQHRRSSDTGAQHTLRSTRSPQTEHLDDDAAWLESIYTGSDHTVDLVEQAHPYLNPDLPLSSVSASPLRCVWLPQYLEAKILLEKFMQDIDHVHHVVHSPSLLTVLDEVYACLYHQGQVKPGPLILLLSIFASGTHSWVQQDCERGLFSTSVEANSQSPLWLKVTEDVLDIAHRTARVSVEGIQGIIIASFVMGNSEGISRRCRSFHNMALLLARELGLHRLDHPSNTHLANSAQAEIGRRVWWYLVASDWSIAARLVGAAQGVYQCHLRQMIVKKPLNINDEAVVDGMSCNEQPLSQPTAMSYSLLRIRLAKVSRNIVDRTPPIMAHAGGPSHDVVMDIDTELQQLINNIPPFFSLPKADLIRTYQLDSLQAAKIAHQGYMFYSLLYAQRCKLHFPFLSRGLVDSGRASSRDICLQTARLIIRTESQLERSELFTATRFKSLGLFLGVFMASIVLLIDLCHHEASPPQEEQREEIADAFRILEEARHESETAAKFLDSLVHVLRKHKVSPPSHTKEKPPEPVTGHKSLQPGADGAAVGNISTTQSFAEPSVMLEPLASPNVLLESNNTGGINMTGGGFANAEDFPSYFAQSFEQGIDVGSIDWNNIFLGLDSSFI
ncbi:MAG: hypothetical protein LQ342_005376 [Letrouitia transgressa]|nr:MAG: hypothetical protein LQ342_005376 [Letrouitia transgressa]